MELIDAHRRYETPGLESKGAEGAGQDRQCLSAGWGSSGEAEGYFQELEHDHRTLGIRSGWWISTPAGAALCDTGEVRQGACLMVEAEALLARQQQDGVLAWSRIELATILLKQGKTARRPWPSWNRPPPAASGEGADSVTLGPLAHRHGHRAGMPWANRPRRCGTWTRPSRFCPEQNLRFLAWVHEVCECWASGRSPGGPGASKTFVQTRHAWICGCRNSGALQCASGVRSRPQGAGGQTLRAPAAVAGAEKFKGSCRSDAYWQFLVVACCCWSLGILVMCTSAATPARCSTSPTDELTSIHNRRQIQGQRAQMVRQARAPGRSHWSVLLLDVDHFKKVSSQLGRRQG